jgi:hypothetical protein
MLARNPKTGGTIRLMKSDASIWKNRKTLVWMKSPPSENANRWRRWDIAVVGVDPTLLEWQPQIVVLINDSPEVRAWLATKAARDTRFILISSKIADAIDDDEFQGFGLGNVLCLEEFVSMYPFLGEPWDGSAQDALVSASIVFRYQRLIGANPSSSTARMDSLTLKPVHLELLETSDLPEQLVLIQQYYKPPQAQRAKELVKCLKKNIENPFIDKIHLFVETKDVPIPADPFGKLIITYRKPRITYFDCIEYIKNKVGPGNIVVFANTDIYLDSTWQQIWSVEMRDVFLALLRWEEEGADGISGPELFGPRSDSQDAWAIHSDSVLARQTWQKEPFNIKFGTPGCDNAILVEFLRQKFKIVNPAMSLRTLHVHKSGIRNYDPKDIIDRPIYMHADPNGIHELNPITVWSGWANTPIVHEPLERPLKATNPKMLGIFCSQINRDPSFVWSSNGTNAYIAPSDQDRIIAVEGGGFVSPNGLVYRHTELCVGNTEIQKTIWSDNKLSHLMPAQETEAMMAFPLEAQWLDRPELFTLLYLSRVLKQHQTTPEASFWCKQNNTLLNVFRLFNWSEPRGRLIQFSEQTQTFAQKIVGRTAHSVRLFPEDINALRDSLYSEWIATPIQEPMQILTIVCDGIHIKDALLADLEAFGTAEGFQVRVVYATADASKWAAALAGASRVILSSSVKTLKVDTWAWLWLAPKGCKVLELQEEREPSDSLVHLSAAAGLEWTLLQYPRATPDGFRKIIMNETKKWMQAAVATNALPLVLTPPKSMKFGYFGHKGDSFREMIDLWAEKGYVEHKEDPIITQCWLGGVGKTLLYDRPTWEWLTKSSDAEQTYKTCLAGNPDASEKPNAKPWTFWPRQPRLVEKLAAVEKGFDERKDRLVFFGRIENDIQGKYRQDVSGWQAVCSKFSMPVGAKQPYTLTPEEYLLALQGSKFGLCLRGFGPKCNREIELLAMGTVPVVTAGVDITGYAEPLIDGIHVLCVSGPEDAKSKIAAVSESQWETMSKAGKMWWKRNASVEGSWLRTQALINM